MKNNPIRAINEGSNSAVTQHRGETYAKCIDKYNDAISKHFFIEAVAIAESLIADRLESRKAVFLESVDENRFSTLGELIKYLKKNESDQGLLNEYSKIELWSKRRNSAVHRIAKIEKDNLVEWGQKYDEIKGVANDGFELFRTLKQAYSALKQSISRKQLGA